MRVAKFISNNSNKFLCQCGCGEFITVKSFHKRIGIPKFIKGHSSRVNNPMSGRHHSEETRKKLSAAHLGKPFSEEHKRKLSESQKGKNHTPQNNFKKGNTICLGAIHSDETKAKISAGNKGKKRSVADCKKIGDAHKGMVHGPETRKKMSVAGKGRKKSLAHRKKISEAHKRCWLDEAHGKKMGKAWGVKPNKPETVILNLLNQLYPGEWKYTGDFSLIINGKNPDFVNCNGQKKIIEFFGDYWHKGEDPQDRINLFKPFGYDTLVVWEYELGDISGVVKKIKSFHESKTKLCKGL